jgi:hypothetical protein
MKKRLIEPMLPEPRQHGSAEVELGVFQRHSLDPANRRCMAIRPMADRAKRTGKDLF